MGRACESTREEAPRSKAQTKEKNVFPRGANGTQARRASWVEWWPAGEGWDGLADRAGWAGPQEGIKWKLIFEFKDFLNLTRLGEILQRI
jgi:hypothetical protein